MYIDRHEKLLLVYCPGTHHVMFMLIMYLSLSENSYNDFNICQNFLYQLTNEQVFKELKRE